MTKIFRVAVVGAGSIGREFAIRHFNEDLGVKVVAIIDRNLEAASLLARDVSYRQAGAAIVGTKYRESVDPDACDRIPKDSLPRVIAAQDLSEVIDEVDICYIGTPPTTHAELAVYALQAAKHVILEKPIAVSNEDAQIIVSAAEDAWQKYRCVVSVNIGMRFCAAANEMKRLINDGYLGELSQANLRLKFLQWPRVWQNQPWVAEREQGGPLLEVGTHWIFGLLEVLEGDEVISVSSEVVFPDGPQGRLCESKCKGVITMKSGLKVVVDVEGSSEEANTINKDIYELTFTGSNGKSLQLYDFTRLKEIGQEQDLVSGTYGRAECIQELVKAIIHDNRDITNLVTPKQAQRVQQVLTALRNEKE